MCELNVWKFIQLLINILISWATNSEISVGVPWVGRVISRWSISLWISPLKPLFLLSSSLSPAVNAVFLFSPCVVFQLILFISWRFMQQVVFFAALLLFYFQNLNVKTYMLPKERCQNVFHCFSNSDEDLSYLLFLLDLTPVFVPLFLFCFYQASSCSFISFLFWIFFSLDSDLIFSPDLLVLTAVAYVLPALSFSCVLLL